MYLLFFLHVWLALINHFLNQLHWFIRVLGAGSKIIFLVHNTMSYWSSKLFQHLKLHIFEIFFFKPFFFCSFELYWSFEMLDGCIITKKSWKFFIPIVSILVMLILRRCWWLGLILISVFKLIAYCHIFDISFLLLEISTDSIIRTLIISNFVIVEVILFQILIAATFFLIFIRMMHLICWVTAVIRGCAVRPLKCLAFVMIALSWRLNWIYWVFFLDHVHSLGSDFRILLIYVWATYLFHTSCQSIYTFWFE